MFLCFFACLVFPQAGKEGFKYVLKSTHAQCFGSQGSKCYVVWIRTEKEERRGGEGGGWISRNIMHIFLSSWKKNTGTQKESTCQISVDSEQLENSQRTFLYGALRLFGVLASGVFNQWREVFLEVCGHPSGCSLVHTYLCYCYPMCDILRSDSRATGSVVRASQNGRNHPEWHGVELVNRGLHTRRCLVPFVLRPYGAQAMPSGYFLKEILSSRKYHHQISQPD